MSKIYTSMPALVADVGAVGKDHRNSAQNYAYRSVDDLMAALHPLLTKHRVTVIPRFSEHAMTELAKGVRVTLKLEMDWCAEDGSHVTTTHYGEGVDFGDKATNKAMAGAIKYAILQTLMVPTVELKDSEADSGVDKAAAAGEVKTDWVKRFRACKTKAALEKALEEAKAHFANKPADDPDRAAALLEYNRKREVLA